MSGCKIGTFVRTGEPLASSTIATALEALAQSMRFACGVHAVCAVVAVRSMQDVELSMERGDT